MINDCAYIGETLIKYLPKNLKVTHLKRSRSILDKTFRIAWKILRAKGNVYHVHYLLQDCYVASKLGKRPLIGHAHGSDIRETIDHFFWGRIVRNNLKNCNKVLVSTPNLLEKARKYNENSEYIPNPVDTDLFYPVEQKKPNRRLRVLIAAGNNWKIRGTDKVLYALKSIEKEVDISLIKYGGDTQKTLRLAKNLGLKLHVLSFVSHNEMPRYYWDTDVVIASIGIGGTLGMVALEAIACGRPVVAHVSSDFSEYKGFPLLDVSTSEDIVDAILSLEDEDVWKKQYAYLKSNHNPERVTKRLLQIYNDTINQYTT
jgi:glycosyltransferase involved in cell wall biosynthesis